MFSRGWEVGDSKGCMRKLLFVMGEGKGCMLMGTEYVWELYSKLNKNFFCKSCFCLYFSIK